MNSALIVILQFANPGSVQGQIEWGLEQPGLVGGSPAHGKHDL